MTDERDAAGACATGRARARRKPQCLWTAERERIFLETLAETANVTFSAAAAGMSRVAAYARKSRKPAFADAWRRAIDAGYTDLEMQLLRHAIQGSERTEEVRDGDGVVRQTKIVRSFPDAIALRLLLLHQDQVQRFRTMEALRDPDNPDMAAKIRAELLRVRARLADDVAVVDCPADMDGRPEGTPDE